MPKAFHIRKLLFLNLLIFVFFSSAVYSAEEKQMPRVFVFTDISGIEDKSFNESVWNGVLSYYGESVKKQKNRGILYDTDVCSDYSKCENQLRDLCALKYDLIILAGFQFESSLKKIAIEFPDQKFAVIDVAVNDIPNVTSFVFNEEQGAYLVGYLAALKAIDDGVENPKFGFIGGVAGAALTRFEMGYIQGIKAVLPNAIIVDCYVESWNKPDLAKANAKKMYDDGVYCIFSAAGFSGTGVILQSKEMRLSGKNVWTIGIDTDQFREGIYIGSKSAVLTSMIKKTNTASKMAVENISNENAFHFYTLNVKNDGVTYSKTNKEIKQSIISKVEKCKTEIQNGNIKIYTTYEETKKAGIAPQGLSAKDK